MPVVSVIIPTYKHRDFVLQALESVFAQTFIDYEVIVVNDGSPDDTATLLRPLAQRNRIRYFEQPNGGQSVARNKGLAEARGRYIALLDDDDIWPSDKLEWQVRALEANSATVLVYGYKEDLGAGTDTRWPMDDAPTGDVRKAFLCQSWLVSPGQSMIRASTLRRIGGFDAKIWGADDWDLYVRLSRQGMFAYENRISLYYRRHVANASSDSWRMYVNCSKATLKSVRGLRSWDEFAAWRKGRRWVKEHFLAQCIHQAKQKAANEQKVEARHLWLKILSAQPSVALRRSVWRSILG